MLKSFDDLVQTCLATKEPCVLLYAFLKLEVLDSKQELASGNILFDAFELASDELDFKKLASEADKQNSDWNMVAVGIATEVESEDQIGGLLEEMCSKITLGDHDFVMFDRDENIYETVREGEGRVLN